MARKYFHVTSALNRESIEAHGLDWRRMGSAPGIAGATVPEEQGIFLVTDEWDVKWFAQMGLEAGHASVDVWEVTLPPELESSDSADYPLVTAPIPRESLELHTKDWIARDPASVVGDLFHEIYYGGGDLKSDLLAPEVIFVTIDGHRQQGADAVGAWARERAHGSPPPPEPRSDGIVVLELSNESGYTIEGIDDDHCLVSPLSERDFWTVVRVQNNQVVEVREFRTRPDDQLR